MALNNNIKKKIDEKTADKSAVRDAIHQLLNGVDEGKQLKRIIESILKTL